MSKYTFSTQHEINEYKQRQQLAEMARLKGIKQAESVTVWEVLGLFGVMILLTIILPVLAGLVADMVN